MKRALRITRTGLLTQTALVTRTGLSLLAAAALLGSSAHAATFSVTGEWVDDRGPIQLPLPPFLGGKSPNNPVMGTVMQTGAAVPGGGPATLTIPAGVISDAPNPGGFLIPVPDVIQLTTSIGHTGPTTTATLMASGGPGGFSYCPGAPANPTCTTFAAVGSQGTVAGILKYTAGPNKFGGTMKVLLFGAGRLLNKGGALPPTVTTGMGAMVPALAFSGLSNPLGGSAPQPVAYAGYAGMYAATQPGGIATHPLSYKATTQMLIQTGPTIGTNYTQSNTGTLFGLTTGAIYGYQPFGAQMDGAPDKTTITGYDFRSNNGQGRILLVSGSLTRTFPTDGSNPPEGSTLNIGSLKLEITETGFGSGVPVGSPAVLLTLGSLVMLSAGFAITRQR